jgi:L-lactate utilization protein LutB
MTHVRASDVLSKINFDNYLTPSESDYNSNKFIATNRSKYHNSWANRTKKRRNQVLRDLEKSVKQIESEKLAENGEILTNKLKGTTTLSRNIQSQPLQQEMLTGGEMSDYNQEGFGGKRHTLKRKHHKMSGGASAGGTCVVTSCNCPSNKKMRKTVKKQRHRKINKHKKSTKKSKHQKKRKHKKVKGKRKVVGTSRSKSSTKRAKKSKQKLSTKPHFRHSNIFGHSGRK